MKAPAPISVAWQSLSRFISLFTLKVWIPYYDPPFAFILYPFLTPSFYPSAFSLFFSSPLFLPTTLVLQTPPPFSFSVLPPTFLLFSLPSSTPSGGGGGGGLSFLPWGGGGGGGGGTLGGGGGGGGGGCRTCPAMAITVCWLCLARIILALTLTLPALSSTCLEPEQSSGEVQRKMVWGMGRLRASMLTHSITRCVIEPVLVARGHSCGLSVVSMRVIGTEFSRSG